MHLLFQRDWNLLEKWHFRQKYLDFLADPISNTEFFADARVGSSTSGHDIEGVARRDMNWLSGNQPNSGNSLLLHNATGTSYADDYRYLAHRGPLVVHGWGYDIHGKPVPNSNIDASGS